MLFVEIYIHKGYNKEHHYYDCQTSHFPCGIQDTI